MSRSGAAKAIGTCRKIRTCVATPAKHVEKRAEATSEAQETALLPPHSLSLVLLSSCSGAIPATTVDRDRLTPSAGNRHPAWAERARSARAAIFGHGLRYGRRPEWRRHCLRAGEAYAQWAIRGAGGGLRCLRTIHLYRRSCRALPTDGQRRGFCDTANARHPACW